MIMRKPVIHHLDDFDGRTIVISDLHGSLEIYEKLLRKVNYVPGQDRLILLGDLIEKGHDNLDLLHKIMKQSQDDEVYCIMGNCDFIGKNVLLSYRLPYLKSVLLNRSESLVHEMIHELGLPALDEDTDMEQLAMTLRKHYLPELSFLNDLPHILETPTTIYAHSGIVDEEIYANDYKQIMARYQFAKEDICFKRRVIVGHMPVSEYDSRLASFNPIVDQQKNIISIDGGNAVNPAGQLNALILERNMIQMVHTDLLPKVRARHTVHPQNGATIYIGFANSHVEVLQRNENQTRVFSPQLGRTFPIDTAYFDKMGAYNYTTYQLPLIAGHTFHLAGIYGDKAQVKHHGVLGWTDLKNLDVDDELKEKMQLPLKHE